MTPSVSSTTSAASQASAAQSAASSAGSTPDVTEGMFLQLLVAQLQNQDPTSPADPTQFIGELAEFSGLEQDISINQNTQTIATDVGQLAGAAASATGANSSGSSASGANASTQTQS